MALKKVKWIGIASSAFIAVIDLIFFLGENLFAFLLGIAFVVGAAPFLIDLLKESKREEETGRMFLEFSRNLAESVSTGTPISKSIVNMSRKNYGPLNPYVVKLANQISLGIPVNVAMRTFADDLDNKIVRRAVALMREAEKAGGEIDYILSSVASSIAETERLKKERRASVFNLVVQGYIIFFIFIGIMLVMEFKILPLTYGSEATGGLFSGADLSTIGTTLKTEGERLSSEQISKMFLYLLITQGLFAGLIIGKLSEGTLKAGIKHSFALTIAAFLISTGARAVIG